MRDLCGFVGCRLLSSTLLAVSLLLAAVSVCHGGKWSRCRFLHLHAGVPIMKWALHTIGGIICIQAFPSAYSICREKQRNYGKMFIGNSCIEYSLSALHLLMPPIQLTLSLSCFQPLHPLTSTTFICTMLIWLLPFRNTLWPPSRRLPSTGALGSDAIRKLISSSNIARKKSEIIFKSNLCAIINAKYTTFFAY